MCDNLFLSICATWICSLVIMFYIHIGESVKVLKLINVSSPLGKTNVTLKCNIEKEREGENYTVTWSRKRQNEEEFRPICEYSVGKTIEYYSNLGNHIYHRTKVYFSLNPDAFILQFDEIVCFDAGIYRCTVSGFRGDEKQYEELVFSIKGIPHLISMTVTPMKDKMNVKDVISVSCSAFVSRPPLPFWWFIKVDNLLYNVTDRVQPVTETVEYSSKLCLLKHISKLKMTLTFTGHDIRVLCMLYQRPVNRSSGLRRCSKLCNMTKAFSVIGPTEKEKSNALGNALSIVATVFASVGITVIVILLIRKFFPNL